MVVARHEIDYRAPILFNDDVRIVTWIEHIGTKSMTAAYEVYKHWQGTWSWLPKAKTSWCRTTTRREVRRHGLKKLWKRRSVLDSGGLIFDHRFLTTGPLKKRQANAPLTCYFIYFGFVYFSHY